MNHLSALDALFLHLETPETPMHVGSLMLLERPKGKKDVFVAIRDHIAARLLGAALRNTVAQYGKILKAVPVSLRAPGDATQANYVSMMLVSLATNVSDPVKRMAAVTPLFRKAVASRRIPVVANVAISNVPDPRVPSISPEANSRPTTRSQS
jgi:hypothetical protein